MAKQRFVLPVDPDPCPDLMIERGPKGTGVGRWVPDDKHTLLAKWLGGTRQARIKWPQRIFIDPFCGPGRLQVEGESFTRDGGALVAWRRSQAHAVPFTRMLVGDIEPERTAACAARLRALNAPVQDFTGPAADTAPEMAAAVPSGALVLAYIDPYNLSYLGFDILKALAKLPKVDLLVHFSTMDLQRNVDIALDDARARFDDAAPGWRDQVDHGQLAKVSLREAFFNYWLGAVKQLGFTSARHMPLIRGDRNAPLYRLVEFSRHPLANKIWDDIAKPASLELFPETEA